MNKSVCSSNALMRAVVILRPINKVCEGRWCHKANKYHPVEWGRRRCLGFLDILLSVPKHNVSMSML